MSAFIYGILLQWRLDLRNKGILLTYYVVPLVFFAFMGGIFTSINPAAKDTLIQSMMIFGVSMGAFLGTPTPLVDVFATDIKKAYRVGGIPLWTIVANNIISAFIHLSIMSMIILLTAPIIYKATVPTNLFVFLTAQSIFILASWRNYVSFEYVAKDPSSGWIVFPGNLGIQSDCQQCFRFRLVMANDSHNDRMLRYFDLEDIKTK